MVDGVRATIIVESDRPDDVRVAELWLSTWRSHLAVVSGDKGCGCCVHIWEIEGPQAIIDQVPESIRGSSGWDR